MTWRHAIFGNISFLEEAFTAASAIPTHRFHQMGARRVLEALLPETGIDIQGHMRSRDELLHASGYRDRIKDFGELVHILDGELRLITPTDPEGAGTESSFQPRSPSPSSGSGQFYQLTHDYIVPSLREWLTRRKKETRRGRAELLIADRAAVWGVRRDNRQLTSLSQWFQVKFWTRKTQWTAPQRKMMKKAGRVHLVRWASGLLVVLGIAIVIQQIMAAADRRHLTERGQIAVASMGNSRGGLVPRAIDDLAAYPNAPLMKELRTGFAGGSVSQKLALAYALASFGPVQVDFLVAQIPGAAASEVDNIVSALGRSRDDALKALHVAATTTETNKDWRLKERLAIVALHLGDISLAQDMCQLRPDLIQRTNLKTARPLPTRRRSPMASVSLTMPPTPRSMSSATSRGRLISISMGSTTTRRPAPTRAHTLTPRTRTS